MSNDDNIVKFERNKEDDSNYDLLKALVNNEAKQKRKKIITICAIVGAIFALSLFFYWKSTLGITPEEIKSKLSAKNCPVIANIDTKIYHVSTDKYHKRLLKKNKAKDNRICFYLEWEAILAGYRKSY